ncbi:MAG TPA: SRPBCC family protein [Acidimicrobiales bacterium]|jgi:uncharacterized protein YndB with AHSA1/START domain
MTTRSVTHTTFVIERTYPVPPKRVFAAFADLELKQRWFTTPPDWVDRHQSLDFRVGGHETNQGGPPGEAVNRFEASYQDIVEDERIVYTYDLCSGDRRMSVSLATIELRPDGDGTHMTFTEQGAFLDGIDDPAQREHGTNLMLDGLGAALAETA